MAWFRRTDKGIQTPTEEKLEVPDGLWFKSPKGKIIHTRELKRNAYVVPDENYHVKIGSHEYFSLLFDENNFTELDPHMESADPLEFTDTKSYLKRIQEAQLKSELKDAVRTAYGKTSGLDIVIGCMDFTFIGGSMGSVVGEKIARAIDYSLAHHIPLLIISKSGGARMMEGGLSLMQMAKVSAKIALLDKAKIPYLSLLTDPTTGGVTASYAMLGDFNFAEPGSLIGFAGPRVIKETLKSDLPKGFQTAEFVLEHGFLDFIIDRRFLKKRIALLLNMLK